MLEFHKVMAIIVVLWWRIKKIVKQNS